MEKKKRRRRRKLPAPKLAHVEAMLSEMGVTNEEVAEAIGVAPQTITRVLNGDRNLSAKMLKKLEGYFNKTASQLLAQPGADPDIAWEEASPAAREEIARYARYVIERDKKAG